ncbi:MAG: 50S ribosomal protein L15 [Pseudodesulfovibrio sp.]|jgi:large subunit ribosomal protein L15|nr:50S ribosomal protein L15 [Pseudodesulfovibrio sp.]
MRLHELYAFPEEYKQRRRIGRGSGSGWGKTAARGHNGQKSRSGGGVRPGFEGGQMPLARRLPKRGFKNRFRDEYETVNVGRLLAMFEGKDKITLIDMYDRGVVKKGSAVKVLGTGDVAKAVTIEAHRFSVSAADKIAKAGGTATALEA